MKTQALDILTELILEDLDRETPLLEANPYHDASGKFTSKGAAAAYKSGAMAAGRAAGLKAKAQGLGKDQIRAAIKAGMEKHIELGRNREQGVSKLGIVRGKVARGTVAGQKAAKKDSGEGEPANQIFKPNAPIKDREGVAVGAGLSAKDSAYVSGLLKPETVDWKRENKAGNIDRVLEMHAAGKMKLNDETVAALKKAREELTKAPGAAPGPSPAKAAADAVRRAAEVGGNAAGQKEFVRQVVGLLSGGRKRR